MQRPTGVTVIAVLAFVQAGFTALAGSILLVFFTDRKGGPQMGLEILLLLIVVVLLFTLLYAVAGFGMWRLRKWGRLLTMAFSVISVLFALAGVLTQNRRLQTGDPQLQVFFVLLWISVNVWILYYLTRPHVKQAFGATGL